MVDNEDQELKDMLKDLIWLNGVIATELIQITENTSRAYRDGTLLECYRVAHNQLKERAVKIVGKYRPEAVESLTDW